MSRLGVIISIMFLILGCGKKLLIRTTTNNLTNCKNELNAQLIRQNPTSDIIPTNTEVVWLIDNVTGACGAKLIAIFEMSENNEGDISINLVEKKSLSIKYSEPSSSKIQKVLLLDINENGNIIQTKRLESNPFIVTREENSSITTATGDGTSSQSDIGSNPLSSGSSGGNQGNGEPVVVFGVVEPAIDAGIVPFDSTIKIAWVGVSVINCNIKEDGVLKDWTGGGGVTTGFRLISNLRNNRKYEITCSTSSGKTIGSAFEVRIGPAPRPVAPSDLKVSVLNSSSMKVEWSDNSSDETGFLIAYVEAGKSDSEVIRLPVEPNTTSYTITNLKGHTEYWVRVEARGRFANSSPTNWISATTPSVPFINLVVSKEINGTYSDGPVDVKFNNVAWFMFNSNRTKRCSYYFNGSYQYDVVVNTKYATSLITGDSSIRISCETEENSTVSDSVNLNLIKWFSVNNVNCETYCRDLGKNNVPSPEGHLCASGELIPASSQGQLTFTYQCWPSCYPHGAPNGKSVYSGGQWRCYGDSQKRDNDRTDIVVGCYCN